MRMIRIRAQRHSRTRGIAILAGLLVLAVTLSACRTPVGVKRVDPRAVRRGLTSNVLSSGELSGPTQNLLRRINALKAFSKDPVAVITRLHRPVIEGAFSGDPLAQQAFVALAEASFQVASDTNDPQHFLAAVVYAWAYLFPADDRLRPDPYDPRVRLAVDLYNRGVSRAFSSPDDPSKVRFHEGSHPIPFGSIDIPNPPSVAARLTATLYATATPGDKIGGSRNHRTPDPQITDTYSPPVYSGGSDNLDTPKSEGS